MRESIRNLMEIVTKSSTLSSLAICKKSRWRGALKWLAGFTNKTLDSLENLGDAVVNCAVKCGVDNNW